MTALANGFQAADALLRPPFTPGELLRLLAGAEMRPVLARVFGLSATETRLLALLLAMSPLGLTRAALRDALALLDDIDVAEGFVDMTMASLAGVFRQFGLVGRIIERDPGPGFRINDRARGCVMALVEGAR